MTPLFKNRLPVGKVLLFSFLMVTISGLTGCGKKGFPEAPMRPDEKIEKGKERKKEDAKRPMTVPNKPFFLDPLL